MVDAVVVRRLGVTVTGDEGRVYDNAGRSVLLGDTYWAATCATWGRGVIATDCGFGWRVAGRRVVVSRV